MVKQDSRPNLKF